MLTHLSVIQTKKIFLIFISTTRKHHRNFSFLIYRDNIFHLFLKFTSTINLSPLIQLNFLLVKRVPMIYDNFERSKLTSISFYKESFQISSSVSQHSVEPFIRRTKDFILFFKLN